MSKIKVLVVDDSALMRQLITKILSSAPDIEVIGSASDPYKAREKILAQQPDVITLDVEMPRMDGLTFLSKLMHARPTPVVMVSSLTEKGCDTTLRALEFGAVDFVTKPKIDVTNGMANVGEEIIEKVRVASRAKVTKIDIPAESVAQKVQSTSTDALITSTHKVIAIGTSTGGTQALTQVLPKLPSNIPGIVVVIHMPPGFTGRFAKRLNDLCQIQVKEAQRGDMIIPGQALIAPGNFHMTVGRSGARYLVKLNESPPVNQFRPSVDVLFNSCAKYVGSNAIGVILTGMGYDGAEGMLAMKQAGAETIAQDQNSSVVFGMPNEAIKRGGVDTVLPLNKVSSAIIDSAKKMTAAV
ncbi:protein-glutamate methylesterase/protein-glutamine glutaminase [Roseiconus lacunae]|uniref:Protein-glutamate methylesterase/protein-glutamine glutaminase n=1 Tax=Roseiconus lacunae TaxID=2605694 RepID=A0ABT7PL85_9BACT|nr:chemotaxis response regulator protein-glutamate methylesterase [Roseiconus lacunae]MCD0460986.1 chemotaxis response regulator protein-glutamate methylesterase [Roseiconus lacunae]MDM4017257.1 chemotaxis response regulator protein-glutamate methylesterase [Roseiconus lacunae]WRQ48826.1 chemotaxis response regulator protein-glutamate methylesterase [Stieleria sp. HD01]